MQLRGVDGLATVGALATGRAGSSSQITFKPYWWEAAPRRLTSPEPPPSATDVVIVGSGFTGLSAALTLTKRGREVVVLDRGVPGFGASTRNGGQVGSGNQKFRVKKLIELRGEAKAVAMLQEGTKMLDYNEHLIQSENIDCHFRRCGRFRAAARPEHYEAMARDLDDLRRTCGVDSFMISRGEQHQEIGSDAYFGGSVLPNDACLHPAAYCDGLMQKVEANGGRIHGNCGCEVITSECGNFVVKTPFGEIACKNVIVATNGYTDRTVPELGRRIAPIGSGLIATAQIPDVLMSRLLPKNRVYGNTKRVFSYFRSAPDDKRIIWGGRVGRLAANTSPRAFQHLARDMLRVFPDLKDTPVTHGWDGMIGYTFDEIPHIGRTAKGVHYAIGYCGTGVSRATYFGHKVALKVLHDPDGRTAFDDLEFPSFPFHPIAKRVVPIVETWYRIRDKTNL